MRADEARDASRLAGVAARALTRRIHETHSGIAGRVFAAVGPVSAPVRIVHDAIAGVAYGSVRSGLGAAAAVAGSAAARRATGGRLDGNPSARVALAVLNGMHGELLQREAPALAWDMTVRVAGRDVALDRTSLRAAFPDATDLIAVFLHGLSETEGAWCYQAERNHGRPEVTYGTLLRRDLGFTPVFIRYNTGLHISDNGHRLDDLLAALVEAWPVEPHEIVTVGHSMGGLVARSALHQAGGGTEAARGWTILVRDTVALGTPHLGAPLERGAHTMTHLLARLPETRPLARTLAARSVGIKDLRRGTLVESDWTGRDLDAPGRGPHTHVPLHEGARHFAVMATLTGDPSAWSGRVVGDLFVPPDSALGDSRDEHRFGLPAERIHHLGRHHHFDLLNNPLVYDQIRQWLADRPGGSSPPRP